MHDLHIFRRLLELLGIFLSSSSSHLWTANLGLDGHSLLPGTQWLLHSGPSARQH